MAQIKVTLTFLYDSDESTKEWQGNPPHKFVTNKEQAIDTAVHELDEHGSHGFEFEAWDEDGELM